ncbi:four helix bundle protein [Leptolyngbya sp. AN02str]|uniref:four helix bundle protein n=1 Tax=Leptolyngbya sp. AN02str TaxID=3423363 RepID=UPI003D315865
MGIHSFRELKAWQVGVDVAEKIDRITFQVPDCERYGLMSQMQRAAVSMPFNLAEGHAKSSTKECLFYVSVALGSLVELETQLLLAKRLPISTMSKRS